MTTFEWEAREQWRAAPPRNRRSDVSPRGVAIHYPGPGQYVGVLHVLCRARMRSWQDMHMKRGSNDIEYGLVLCEHLRLMEGRVEQDKPWVRVGSNGNAAANTTHTSIQLMRGTMDPPPTEREITALGEAVAWLREKGGWGPEVTGHRDHHATACPGDALYRRLADIRRIADEGSDDDMPLTDGEKREIARLSAREVLRGLEWAYKSGEESLPLAAHVSRIRRDVDRLLAGAAAPVEPDEPDDLPCDGYRVVAGDTLGKIAAAHDTNLSDLLAANPQITDPNRIKVGDCITVPKAKTAT